MKPIQAMRTRPRRTTPKRRRRSRGFTLIELMMALLVGAIVLTGVFAFSSIQQSTASMQRRQIRVQHALEGAMWAMARDVRLAGFGFSRQCTEIRIWAPDLAGPVGTGRLVNPGAADQPNLATDAAVDPITREPYWVLRDGIQAHWRSSQDNNNLVDTTSIAGGADTSASALSAADSLDVVLAERNMAQPAVFRLAALDADPPASSNNASLFVAPSGLLGGVTGEAAIRQMFPPGSFVLLSPTPPADSLPFMPQQQQQCVVVQITDDVQLDGLQFRLPIANNSDFNQNLAVLMGQGRPNDGLGTNGIPASYTASAGQAPFDWNLNLTGAATEWTVSPLGRLRWSRYEIDYTVPGRPYLVRTDFISHVPAVDGGATYTADVDYPDCPQGEQCTLPQLHLPGGDVDWEDIPRVAIGPMIEDMQVAVGCDGYTQAGAQNVFNLGDTQMTEPDPGFEERPEPSGTGLANLRVDEWAPTQDRGSDEWLGNAEDETWGPDCVYYGTGEYRRAEWASNGPAFEQLPGPAFRMSPQMVRVTLLAKPDIVAPAGNAFESTGPASLLYNQLFPIEDRPAAVPVAPNREYFTLTETFSPKNLRWRDTRI